MKYCSVFTFMLLFILPLFGQIESTGNETYWDEPTSWSSGTIPTANDEIIIRSGHVILVYGGTSALAKKITVEDNAFLLVLENGRLTIDGNPTFTTAASTVGLESRRLVLFVFQYGHKECTSREWN